MGSESHWHSLYNPTASVYVTSHYVHSYTQVYASSVAWVLALI